MMRLTQKNPDGCTYRIAGLEERGIKVEYFMGYPVLSGEKIDLIGRIENEMPLEKLMELVKETKK